MHYLLRTIASLAILALLVLPQPASRPAPTAPGTAASAPLGNTRFLVLGLTQDLHRTDTIMVVEWDDLHAKARILGIPRDIGVPIANIGITKIVHAYATGGIGRTRAAVVRLLDVPIAHYIVFTLPALRHLVDLVGGVSLNVEKRMLYRDREQGLFINLYPGPQLLDGAQAEQYVRFRGDSEGDIGRIRRQQQFLRAALAAVHRPMIWMRLPQIAQSARAEIDTDLTASDMLGWARRLQGLPPDAISAYTIEGQPVQLWDALAKMTLDFWSPDPDDLAAKVRWLVTGTIPPPIKP
jgi:polyisoprenyl-teichoic acid--peptidoglycan teichoic acid transferase